jgi:hypothetical protein
MCSAPAGSFPGAAAGELAGIPGPSWRREGASISMPIGSSLGFLIQTLQFVLNKV